MRKESSQQPWGFPGRTESSEQKQLHVPARSGAFPWTASALSLTLAGSHPALLSIPEEAWGTLNSSAQWISHSVEKGPEGHGSQGGGPPAGKVAEGQREGGRERIRAIGGHSIPPLPT